MPKSKSQAQKRHAARRFNERYGVKLTQHVWDQIIHKIHSGKATLVEKQSNRVKLYDVFVTLNKSDILSPFVKVDNLKIRVVYDKQRGNVVSALPLDSTDLTEE